MKKIITFMLLLLMGAIMSKGYAKAYDLYVGGVQVTDDNASDIIGLTQGKVSYDSSTKTLMLDNVIYSMGNSDVFIENIGVEGLTIYVKDSCSIVARNAGLSLKANTTLRGDSVKSSFLSIYSSKSAGLSPSYDAVVTIKDMSLEIIAKYPIFENWLDGDEVFSGRSSLYIDNVAMHAELVNTNSGYSAIRGLKSLTLENAQFQGNGYGSEFKDGKVVNEDGSSATIVNIDPAVTSIYIDDYEWPQDFVAADYDVTTTNPGVKSITVGYELYRKELPWQDGFNVRANTNYGVYFFVELKEGYTFAQKVKAYVKRDGEWMANPYSTTVNQKKAFIWAAYNETEFKVPVPEGGAYVHTANVVADIAAPEVGAMPQWTIETPAQAKAAGGLPEADAKDLDEHSIIQSSEVSWLKVDAQGYTTEMSKDEKFAPGTKYCCRLFIQPKENMQFHENTRYTFNGKVCGAFNGEVEQGNIFVKGDTCFGGMYDSQLAGIIKVFPATKGDYLGDANQDGTITMADANAVVNYFLAVEKPEGFPLHLANVNGDYDNEGNPTITMADANQIVNMFLSGAEPQIYYDPTNGHKYVDLGLSVNWATCNIGADAPYEYGDYFAWGETQPKNDYSYSTYKWCNGSETTLTKYNIDSSYGTVDNKTTLEPADDAATVNWGGAWRMPTHDEQLALIDSCYWEWTTNYDEKGITGYIVYKAKSEDDMGVKRTLSNPATTSNSYSLSDTHIFLPAAGLSFETNLNLAGQTGNYWSTTYYSTLSTSTTGACAYFLNLHPRYARWRYEGRCCGLSVRPVLQK